MSCWLSSGRPSSNAARLVFSNQVVDAAWRTTCPYTRAPTLDTVFSLCLQIKSWYDLGERNLTLLHCSSNRPNVGILAACFLKFIGAFEHAAHAYDFYCSKRYTPHRPT
ncbi:hypothetical protein EON64_13830 [archaeon]|nr:MAG: hypothetical protein EON64_13830 [archaeon]